MIKRKLTLTSDTSIFIVCTVVYSKSSVRTVKKSCLSAGAEQIIQENGASSLAKAGIGKCNCTCKKMQSLTVALNI